MQLVAYGAQDIYLTGNPQITFFKVVYRRHTNFSMECIQQTISGSSQLSSSGSTTGTVTISRNGDLVSGIHIASSTLNIHHGDELVKDVELEIGGQKIDKHDTRWMQIWTELTTPKGKKDGVAFMTASAGHPSSKHAAERGIYGVGTVILPLQFWFCRNPGLALPLIALQYHEVKLKINWAQGGTTTAIYAEPVCEVWADYVYLDTDERRRFAQVSHEYLIEQVQHQSSAASASIKLNFNHPVKELLWTDLEGEYYDKCRIQLNGHDRFAKQPPEYFQLKQINNHHTSIPRLNIPTLGSHKQLISLTNDPVADVSEGLNATAATTITEFNLFVSSVAGQDGSTARQAHNRHSNVASGDGGAAFTGNRGKVKVDAIAAGTFTAQAGGTNRSRFLAINATAAASPLVPGTLIIGKEYTTKIVDVDGVQHATNQNQLLALYKRNADGSVAAGTGPIRATDGRGRPQIVTAAGTSIKANMIVCEFKKDIFNGNGISSAVALADGDVLKDLHLEDDTGKGILHGDEETGASAHGEVTSLSEMINVYSFALKPEEHQPSGTCNFSRIDNAKLIFDTPPAGTVDIYAFNYNVLRIMSGMGGLAYSN